MTDMKLKGNFSSSRETAEIVRQSLKKRYAAERRFRVYGVIAVCTALAFLFIMLGNIIYKGHSAFVQTKIQLEVFFDEVAVEALDVLLKGRRARGPASAVRFRGACAGSARPCNAAKAAAATAADTAAATATTATTAAAWGVGASRWAAGAHPAGCAAGASLGSAGARVAAGGQGRSAVARR